jgi:type I restriction enzyme S subunit
MLPDGWRKKSFGDVVYIANGLVDPRKASFKNTKHIGPENVISDTGRIVNERTCGDLKLISGKYEFDKNSIVYSKIRPNLNKVCTPSYSGVCSADMYVLHPRKGIDKNFLFFSILGDTFKTRAISMSMRTGMPKINREDLSSIPLLLPPFPEQKKIAAILSTWDRAIEGTEKLLVNSQQQKKALMQQLLTAKKRLPGFTGEWENVLLKNIALIKKGQALSSKDLMYGDYPVIAGGKTSPYTHKHFTHENVITVSASGAYAGYVSFHSYKIWASDCSVITSRSGNNISFIYFWLSYLQNKIFSLQSGGAQPHIYPRDLELLHIHCPPLSEQKAIAAVLTTADEEITALESDLSRLRQEKKALMQQLLTGKRRVTVD